MTYAAQEVCGTNEDEPMNKDELMNRRKLVMHEMLRDAEAARRRRGDPQKQCVEGGEHHEAEVVEGPMCLAGRDSFMIVLKRWRCGRRIEELSP